MSLGKDVNFEEPLQRRFKGKTVLITGAAGGVGSETARAFSKEGARLVLCDLPSTEPKLKQLVTVLLSLGSPTVIYVCGDVTSVEDVKKSVQHGVDKLGGIDILLNSAGIAPVAPLQLTDEAMFKTVQDVNVYGTFLMMKYTSNQMIKSEKGGVIINMSSFLGMKGGDPLFAYTASKFAVSGMTRAAAKSLAKHNIRVCAIAPHMLEGDLADKVNDDLAELMSLGSGNQNKEEVKAAVLAGGLQEVPLGHFGQMRDVAGVVLFLCSKESSYITGVVLPVDGGATA